MAKSSVSLKLLINTTKCKRVLFAEAGKDFVDFLFHILSLPIANIIRLLQAQGMEGSLPNLYKSLDNLNDTYILPNISKDTFLKPGVPLSSPCAPLLALNYEPSNKLYGCSTNSYNNCKLHVSDDPLAVCPLCRAKMSRQLTYLNPPAAVQKAASGEGGLVKGVVTYMVMDDLVVKPMSNISSLTLLSKFKVKEVGDLEEKVVNLGVSEAVKLLKASLDSKAVLTDIFC